jgi:cytidylate kinase
VDGPAASGKGTLARRLAAHYGLNYLDTGLLYRAVAHRVVCEGRDPADAVGAEAVAHEVDLAALEDPALRDEAVSQIASVVAAYPGVRAALLARQRALANTLPGAILDGRDIGTVVCPDAHVKIFLEASVEARAARRLKELRNRGDNGIKSRVLQDMKARDARDRAREAAPLKAAQDAFVIETDDLGPDEVFARAVGIIASRLGG